MPKAYKSGETEEIICLSSRKISGKAYKMAQNRGNYMPFVEENFRKGI